MPSSQEQDETLRESVHLALHAIEVPATLEASLLAKIRLESRRHREESEQASGLQRDSEQSSDSCGLTIASTSDKELPHPPSKRQYWHPRLTVSILAACIGLIAVGLLFYPKQFSTAEVIAFGESQIARIEDEETSLLAQPHAQPQDASWGTKRLSEFIWDNLSFSESSITGITFAEDIPLGERSTTWRIRSKQMEFYVVEIEDAKEIEGLGRILRIVESSGTWSIAALRDGNSVFLVASRGNLQPYLRTRQA